MFLHVPFRKKKAQHYKLQAAAHACLDTVAKGSEVLTHSPDPTSNVKTATESEYWYAEVQGVSDQLEQVDANEDTYAEIRENELHPYQLSTASNEALSEPTEADNDHMYAEVTKERKLPTTASEEMTEPPQAAQISGPPTRPAPYKRKICL